MCLFLALATALPVLAHTEVDLQIQELNRGQGASPLDGETLFRRAEMERSLGRWDAAIADYESAERLSPHLKALDLAYGTMWLEAGEPEKALPRLERFAGANPDDANGHLELARVLSRLRHWRRAVDHYDRAIALFEPAQPDVYVERAAAQSAQGRCASPEAVRDLDDGIARLGEPITLQLAALELELAMNRFDDALIRIDRIAARSPKPALWDARRAEIEEAARRGASVCRWESPDAECKSGVDGSDHAPNALGIAEPNNDRSEATSIPISLHDKGGAENLVSYATENVMDPAQNVVATIPSVECTPRKRTLGPYWTQARATSSADHSPLAPAVTVTRGPYLQSGAATSIVVRWRTSSATDSRVQYGGAPASLTQSVSSATLTTEHIMTLTGLAPATTYYYSVGTTAGPLAGADANHVFLTAPTPGTAAPYRFWVIGDSGTSDTNAQAVRDAYAAFAGPAQTHAWLMLGDNAYTVGTDAQFQSAVFDMYPAMLRKSVLWPAYGNHDSFSANATTQSGPYFDIFSLPKSAEAGGVASGTEAYYSFDYGNVHFICLESMDSTFRSPAGMQMMWLQQDLMATNKNWIIAFWHHPPYTKGSHDSDNGTGNDPELVEMRQNFLPVLEAAGVDLVLSGHSHSYERSFLIDGHYGFSGTFTNAMKKDGGDGRPGGNGAYAKPTLGKVPHEGAVYAVAGSSGQISGGPLNHPAMFVSWNRLGSLVLDVNGGRLDARFLDHLGATLDTFTLLKGAPSPRSVPDGGLEPGTEAKAQKLTPDASTIHLTWDVSTCRASTQYEALWGKGSDLATYTLSGAACNIGNTGSYDWTAAPAVPAGESFLWWTIVGTDGLSAEGSWGHDSSGNERHAASASGKCGVTTKVTTYSCP